jgi:hypothetical protein
VLAILLCSSCSRPPGPTLCRLQITAPAPGYGSACIDIHGTVAGNIIPGAQVYLFQPSNLNPSSALAEIRTSKALSWQPVNESGAFEFRCLPPGEYVFVIPTSSYKGWIGFPLPYEFDCENFSVRIVFHGGDYQYAVGAFKLIDSRIESLQKSAQSPSLCRGLIGPLYIECYR